MKEKKKDEQNEQIIELGSDISKTSKGNIYTLTIIGQVEGHQVLPETAKTTKYEHILPLLAGIEESDEIDGLLYVLGYPRLRSVRAFLGYENPDDKRDPRNGFVTGMRCIRMELGEPDERGRRRPVEVPGSEFTLDVDTVIMSIGTSPNPLIKSTTAGLEVNRWGGIIVTEDGATTKEGVYAGGDAVTGAATVISAMGAGKIAAASIHEYIKNR